MLRTALRLPTTRALALASTAVGVALATVPLFGVHGVESAIVLGALVPPMAAVVGARLAVAARRSQARLDVSDLALQSVGAGLVLLALPVLLLALNALRVKNCAPLEGLIFIGLGPTAGVVLAAIVGTAVGCLPWSGAMATLWAAAIVLGASALALVRIWATPAVFAFGHFFGYFPGSLYDEIVPIPSALTTLRVVTSVLVLALLSLLRAHFDPARGSLGLRPLAGATALSALGVVGLGLGVAAEVFGAELGLRTSAAYIESELGGRVESARCELIVPREMRRSRVMRLAQDCDFRVTQMERWLGLRQPDRVRVYLFRSSEEKRRLMGAATTNIAKPWRREVYLQDRAWPHAVLAHEVAHVVVGNVAPGPFRLAGKLGGVWPDAALVEGVAVAAAWEASSQSGLTPHQWARAMIELDIAPPLAKVFGAGFFGQQKNLAYTLAGSLLRYVADTHGAAALRRVYRQGDLELALGQELAHIESAWRAYVMRQPLPDAARALAELRFGGASILSSVCPHQVATLKEALGQELAAGDDTRAISTCRNILDMDPNDAATRVALVPLLARNGGTDAAARGLAELRATGPAALAQALRHSLADEAWRAGRLDEAASGYRTLVGEAQGRDQRRLLQVKALALAGSAREAQLLFNLLVGSPGAPTDGATAVHLARELRGERTDGLAHYLEARQLYNNERFHETAQLLAEARTRGLPSPELASEALRVEAASRFAAGERDHARSLWGHLWREGDPAQVAEAADWLARIRQADRASAPTPTAR